VTTDSPLPDGWARVWRAELAGTDEMVVSGFTHGPGIAMAHGIFSGGTASWIELGTEVDGHVAAIDGAHALRVARDNDDGWMLLRRIALLQPGNP
jgi:hypothetical protein